MPAGLGGGGYLALKHEATLGTFLPPTTAGTIFVPILEESLAYQEDKYYSGQIRQTTIASEVKSSYYSVAGDVTMEVDPAFLPYFLHCSRHTIAKTGAGPFEYTYTPSSAGSASTAASGNVPRTASISVFRNGVGFGYAGCVVSQWAFTVEDGVLRVTMTILGVSETDTTATPGTPTWAAANLFGADAHSVFIGAAAVAPTFGAADTNHNGFTFTTNYNAEAQNRINQLRSASYISYGETEATYETELDFLSRVEYDNFKNASKRSLQFLSTNGGLTYTLATSAVEITINNSVYDAYELGLAGMGELIMAGVTGRSIGIAGGNPYQIRVKSAATIT
jgi:hypothetical protein